MKISVNSYDILTTFFYFTPQHCKCSGAGEIGQLENLESLNFGNCTKLKSLPESVKQLKKLKYLNLNFTLIPDDYITELKKALPNCKIEKFKMK